MAYSETWCGCWATWPTISPPCKHRYVAAEPPTTTTDDPYGGSTHDARS
jgi:hypothetical protein